MNNLVLKVKGALFLARHPTSIPNAAFAVLMGQMRLRQALFRYVDWRDRYLQQGARWAFIAPASLRYRVHGDLSTGSFLQSGEQCSQDIKAALAKAGKDIKSFQQILDFGCGCGRTMIWLEDLVKSATLFGTDIDQEAIAWCKRKLDFASFETNDPLSPLNFPSNSFDLVYAISVFTHLNEEHQFCWLNELKRVTKSKGVVLLTVHGSYYWDKMLPAQVEEIKRAGYRFMQGPKSMGNIFPEWYQSAFHTQQYVLSNYSKYFDVLGYLPSGMDGCQDVVILQKT